MGIWEDIEKHGPGGPSEVEKEYLLKYKDIENMSEEEIEKMLQDRRNMSFLREFYRREKFIDEFSWSVPSKEAVEKIKEFIGNDKILEVGSGYGLWAKLLIDAGINLHATDPLNWTEYYRWHPSKKKFTPIEPISNVEAIKKYPGYNVLMMSWPTYDDPMALDSLREF